MLIDRNSAEVVTHDGSGVHCSPCSTQGAHGSTELMSHPFMVIYISR